MPPSAVNVWCRRARQDPDGCGFPGASKPSSSRRTDLAEGIGIAVGASRSAPLRSLSRRSTRFSASRDALVEARRPVPHRQSARWRGPGSGHRWASRRRIGFRPAGRGPRSPENRSANHTPPELADFRTMSATAPAGEMPSAMRMPISRVRRVTTNAAPLQAQDGHQNGQGGECSCQHGEETFSHQGGVDLGLRRTKVNHPQGPIRPCGRRSQTTSKLSSASPRVWAKNIASVGSSPAPGRTPAPGAGATPGTGSPSQHPDLDGRRVAGRIPKPSRAASG